MSGHLGGAFRVLGISGLASSREIRGQGERLRIEAFLSSTADQNHDTEVLESALRTLNDEATRIDQSLYWFWQPTGHWIHSANLNSRVGISEAIDKLLSGFHATPDVALVRAHDLALLRLFLAMRSDASLDEVVSAGLSWTGLFDDDGFAPFWHRSMDATGSDPVIAMLIKASEERVNANVSLLLTSDAIENERYLEAAQRVVRLRTVLGTEATKNTEDVVSQTLTSRLLTRKRLLDLEITRLRALGWSPPFRAEDNALAVLLDQLLPVIAEVNGVHDCLGNSRLVSPSLFDEVAGSIHGLAGVLHDQLNRYFSSARCIALAHRTAPSASARIPIDKAERVIRRSLHFQYAKLAASRRQHALEAAHATLHARYYNGTGPVLDTPSRSPESLLTPALEISRSISIIESAIVEIPEDVERFSDDTPLIQLSLAGRKAPTGTAHQGRESSTREHDKPVVSVQPAREAVAAQRVRTSVTPAQILSKTLDLPQQVQSVKSPSWISRHPWLSVGAAFMLVIAYVELIGFTGVSVESQDPTVVTRTPTAVVSSARSTSTSVPIGGALGAPVVAGGSSSSAGLQATCRAFPSYNHELMADQDRLNDMNEELQRLDLEIVIFEGTYPLVIRSKDTPGYDEYMQNLREYDSLVVQYEALRTLFNQQVPINNYLVSIC